MKARNNKMDGETIKQLTKMTANSFYENSYEPLELYRFHDSNLAEEITETANDMMEELRKHLIEEK
jgi:pyruvate-formate lyase-activating enzyme